MYAQRFFSITLLLSLGIFFLLLPSPAQSAPDCKTPPQYKGPFAILFNRPQDNCAYDPSGLAALEHKVSCMENASQTFDLLTNADYAKAKEQIFTQQKDWLTGRNTLIFNDIANITHPSDVLEEALSSISPRLSRLSSYTNYTDPASYKAQCMAANNTTEVDRLNCARQYQDTITGSSGIERENLLATQNLQEAMLTEPQRYQLVKNRCQAIISAPSTTNPATKEHIYYINQTTSALDVCQTLPQTYDQFKALDAGQKQLFFSIEGSKAMRIAYIVFEVQTKPTILEWFTRNNTPRTEIYEIPIEGLVSTLENSLINFKIQTTLKDQQATFDRLYNQASNPNPQDIISTSTTHRLSEYQLIIDKINRSGQQCDNPAPGFAQMSGAFAPARTGDGDEIGLSFEWFWRMIDTGFDKLVGSTQTTVKGWVLWPIEYEYLAQIYGTDANALFGAWATKAQRSSEPPDVFIPQNISYEAQAAHPTYPTWQEEVGRRPCPTGFEPGEDGLCPVFETKTAQVTASSDAPTLSLQAPGGWLLQLLHQISNKSLMPSHLPDWWGNTSCYFDELSRRTNLGVLGTAANALAPAYLSYCQTQRRPPSTAACWSGNTSELVSSAGECGLNLTNFNGYLNAYGINGLPPTAIQIIETAALANNIPANLIIGLLMTEGSFENRAWDWSENMVRSASICGGQVPSCTANSAGALGPYQIIPSWHPNFTGDPCNFYEATMYVATLLAKYKNGASADFYALTVGQYGDQSTNNGLTCNNITYNTGGGEASTCTNWSTIDAATTYRFHRGICDIRSQTFFINIFQGKAPQ